MITSKYSVSRKSGDPYFRLGVRKPTFARIVVVKACNTSGGGNVRSSYRTAISKPFLFAGLGVRAAGTFTTNCQALWCHSSDIRLKS